MKIGLIGLGKMGEALWRGLQAKHTLQATTASGASALKAAQKLGAKVHHDNVSLVRESEIILLCVKPHLIKQVLEEIRPALNANHTLVSVAAAVSVAKLETWSGGLCGVVRAMPNTPSFIQAGMTVFCVGSTSKDRSIQVAKEIFSSVGEVAAIDESQMDGATGLSGCGPAYAYIIIEALSDGGVKAGLTREQALKLAAQTMLGAAQMVLHTGRHPGELKDAVTTPGGCTIEGVAALERGKIRSTLIEAVLAAAERSRELGVTSLK